ncbi:sarcosine oxidase subunit gamma [Paracoccus aminovorans]|uniref:Sarcosine oxidase subunit gamma n=1 Tax=Paracoccus aminovorans TaxID=34004 RepID=A0A1I3DNU7_9RHOB|nr:sarcosine oxidase subunit gamma [Paracoccus aminovorans]CQR83911.1 N-methylglutamate dehydrogenase subunit D [Paracoccus aminovorans]SFH88151.1 sarcosine oxidase subunit gamma [Paracoccus aminovorans]
MTDLTPICALGAAVPQSRRIGAVTLTENAELGLASLALRRGGTAPDLGLALPGPGGWAEGGGIAAFWTGPDQWMVEFPGRAAEDVAALLAAPGCSVTEQTDGFVAFEIQAPEPALLALLSKLVNVDPARFGPGAATRTGFHHMSVFVIRRAADRLALLGMRSAAGTIWHALVEAAERQEEMA